MAKGGAVIDQQQATAFLTSGRIAVVGASDDPKNFGGNIRRSLIEHGADVVTVNPTVDTVGGEPAYATVTDVPGDIDGVLVMISGDAVLDVIRASHERGIDKVWLFKGIGGPGAASKAAVELCDELGMAVIAGACPLMFLEPVHGGHRFHRALRRLNRSVGAAA
jgi:predicted CoA-binding protein